MAKVRDDTVEYVLEIPVTMGMAGKSFEEAEDTTIGATGTPSRLVAMLVDVVSTIGTLFAGGGVTRVEVAVVPG